MPDDHTHGHKGPEGRYHYPNWRTACWRGDPFGCCLVCYIRLLTYPVRHVLRRLR